MMLLTLSVVVETSHTVRVWQVNYCQARLKVILYAHLDLKTLYTLYIALATNIVNSLSVKYL